MSTLPIDPEARLSPAHVWFSEHHAELLSRARQFARRFPRGRRPDAVAEILGQVWRYVCGAVERGRLPMLTTFMLISFFGRSYAAGRRLCGTRSTDVLSSDKRCPPVVSLDEPRIVRNTDDFKRLPLSEVLADRRVANPLELARQDIDYPTILRRQKASRRARQVFAWLAQTQGGGRQSDLARELGISPPRVVSLKRQLARCLAAEDYVPAGCRPRTVQGGAA